MNNLHMDPQHIHLIKTPFGILVRTRPVPCNVIFAVDTSISQLEDVKSGLGRLIPILLESKHRVTIVAHDYVTYSMSITMHNIHACIDSMKNERTSATANTHSPQSISESIRERIKVMTGPYTNIIYIVGDVLSSAVLNDTNRTDTIGTDVISVCNIDHKQILSIKSFYGAFQSSFVNTVTNTNTDSIIFSLKNIIGVRGAILPKHQLPVPLYCGVGTIDYQTISTNVKSGEIIEVLYNDVLLKPHIIEGDRADAVEYRIQCIIHILYVSGSIIHAVNIEMTLHRLRTLYKEVCNVAVSLDEAQFAKFVKKLNAIGDAIDSMAFADKKDPDYYTKLMHYAYQPVLTSC